MADPASIRSATVGDLPRVLDLDHVKERADDLERAVIEGRCSVAVESGSIVGLSVAGTFFGFDFLDLLLVDPSHRRRGIGMALVHAWEEGARTPKLFTSTNQSNLPMQRLCERLGYVRSGVIEHLDEEDPEIVYFKPAPDR
jgi:GNAT superfamily N-acetyltransferase